MSVTSGDRLPPPAGDPARADAPPAEPAGCPGPAWSSLPEPVRSRLAEAASVAVGALPVDDVPIPLRRLARFTPAKRSRLGRPALLAELEASVAFRAAVGTSARAGSPAGGGSRSPDVTDIGPG